MHLKLPTLKYRRLRGDTIEVYKLEAMGQCPVFTSLAMSCTSDTARCVQRSRCCAIIILR